MKFEQPLRLSRAHGRSVAEIRDAAIKSIRQPRLNDVNSVRWKLFAVRAQVRCGESKFPAELLPRYHGAENRIFSSEHLRGFDQVTLCDRAPDRRAAYDFAVHRHRLDAHHVEIAGRAELFQQSEITGTSLPERPLVPDANLPKRMRMVDKLVDKIFRRRRGELQIEPQDEQMRHAEITDERDLMLRRGQQMRRVLRTQHFRRMRIERHD